MLKTPALQLLCQGYLSLDWPDDYDGDPWVAVADFAASEPEAVNLADEIEAVLVEFTTEEAVRHFVCGDLDLGYLPESDGWQYRAWLSEIARRMSPH